MYALLDWDGTLRFGATVYAWMDFLYERGLLAQEIMDERHRLSGLHQKGEISHDKLAERANQNYLNGVKGMAWDDYQRYAREFWELDPGPSIPSTRVACEWMRRHGVEPVVISGSTVYLLRPHLERMGVKTVFALREEIVDGVLTGRPVEDWGHAKLEAVEKCREIYGEPPVLAMGDSESDIPLLDMARIRIVVGRNERVLARYEGALGIGRDEEGAKKLSEYLAGLQYLGK